MFELREEETLMSSSDNSVKLTSHRITYESEGRKQQIMLEDFVSYELKNRSIGAYGFLLLFFIIVTVVIVYNKIENYLGTRQLMKILDINLFDVFWRDTGFLFLLIVVIIVHIFYLISRRYMIRINGKYNSFEFRVKSFKSPSVKKMLNKLVEQSNKRKSLQ